MALVGATVLLSVLVLASGCVSQVDADPQLARGSSSSSEALSGSCATACGGQSDDGCYCDDLCEDYGDCCDDYQSACLTPPSTTCLDDSHCDNGEVCVAEDTESCFPPGALCAANLVACQGSCQPLLCPAFVPSCNENEVAADTNGDGCINGCVPVEIECFEDSVCPQNHVCVAIDLDTQGCCPPNAQCSFDLAPCAGVCQALPVCPEYYPVCGNNEEVADTNGDGCIDGCVPMEPVYCDVDGDCADGYCEEFVTCMALGCPPPPPSQCVFPNCNDETIPVCKLAAMPVCADDEVLAIKDGCFSCVNARTCELPEVELEEGQCNTDADCDANEHCQAIMCFAAPCPPGICEANECLPILCDVGTAPTDTTNDGCYDACLPTAPSCAGHCGGEADGCFCDEICAYYGDCCADVADVCQ